MYGMVNKAVEEMVCMQHGESAWEQIKAKAGVDVPLKVDLEIAKYLEGRGEKKIKADKAVEFKDPSGVQDMF